MQVGGIGGIGHHLHLLSRCVVMGNTEMTIRDAKDEKCHEIQVLLLLQEASVKLEE